MNPDNTNLVLETLKEYDVELTYEAMIFLNQLPIDQLARHVQVIIDASLEKRKTITLGD